MSENNNDQNHKEILHKAQKANLGDITVTHFMSTHVVSLRPEYTVKSTIEAFRVHHISGAPVVDHQEKIIGVISEYDLLIQSASRLLSGPINYNAKITAIYPETTLKDVLVIFYKHKLKWLPVIDKENFVLGVVTRIDVLHYIAHHSDN